MEAPSTPGKTIAELGEQGLLKLLQSYCPADVVGDDAALLTPEPGQQLVVTTDVLVEGVHFSDRTTPPHSAGWRAVAANLSDLAAMGASGLGITVGLSLTQSCPVEWVRQLYQGMTDCLSPHGIAIVGGDVCRAKQRAIAITAFGQVQPDLAWRRHTAQAGDFVVVTGSHGGSRAGLALLLNEAGSWGDTVSQLPWAAKNDLIRQHQYPQPRLDWVRGLGNLGLRGAEDSKLGAAIRRISAMDSSDGLADALLQLCRASQVGARLDSAKIPVPQSLQSSQDLALDWALYGGEDFELILSMAPALAIQICAEPSLSATIIGQITSDRDVALHQKTGFTQTLSLNRGFQHFATGT